MLYVKDLSCGYRDKPIVKKVSFDGKPGDIICLLGPNGSGKSTLIKTLVGLLEPMEGSVYIGDENINGWTWNRRAKTISYIPQTFTSTFQYTGLDIVLMGRTSYLGFGSSPTEEDVGIALEAMEMLNILKLKDKIYSNMSGGERQLVKIAQAIAQQSKIIIMDEPTNNLDFGNQIATLNYLKKCAERGMIVIMATHLPEQALSFGTKALLVKDGEAEVVEEPDKNLKADDLKDLYDIDVEIVELRRQDKIVKMCLPVY